MSYGHKSMIMTSTNPVMTNIHIPTLSDLRCEENQKVLIKEKVILSQIEKFNKRYDKKILRDIKFFII